MSDVIFTLFVWMMFSHFVSDFILQPEWMAVGKVRTLVLLAHVIVYAVGIFCGLSIFNLVFPLCFSYTNLRDFTLLIFVSHFVIDFITAKLNKYFWNKRQLRRFFVCIGFDQFLHVSFLLYSVKYLLEQ